MSENERRVQVERGPKRCAFCHDDVPEEERVACASCFAAHHRACWDESKVCATCRAASALVPDGARPASATALAVPARGDPAIVSEFFEHLGYESIGHDIEGVEIFRRSRRMIATPFGETFSDFWVVVRAEGDVSAAKRAVLDAISKKVYERFWHRITRDVWVNFVFVGEELTGLPAPIARRRLLSPNVYTVTTWQPKTGAIDSKTTWTGSIKAKPILIALRYALESGTLPKKGSDLDPDLGRAK